MKYETQNTRITAVGVVIRILVIAMALVFIVATYFISSGFKLYHDALATQTPKTMAASIRAQESFTPIDQLPDLYLQAVVAMEDHRFMPITDSTFLQPIVRW